MPQGGQVTIKIKNVTLSEGEHTGDHVAITIEDTGVGIPQDVVSRVFEPFFTTKPVGIGLGLGLSISQDIVREFHGQLSAENPPEGGARFVLLLPEKGPHDTPPDPAHKPPTA
jgi:C4-dicarboxylate-specific signal transduction histidine kinase